MSRLSMHDVAIIALCLGVSTVSDHYRLALMLTHRHARRGRAGGTPARWFGASL